MALSLRDRLGLAKKQVEAGVGLLSGPPTGLTCLRPFYYMHISPGGWLYPCCPGFVTMPLGIGSNVRSFESAWNGAIARTYRTAMLSSRLDSVCRRDQCMFFMNGKLPRLANKKLNMAGVGAGLYPDGLQSDAEVLAAFQNGDTRLNYSPRSIALACDKRCNLSCASCRSTRTTTLGKEESAFLDKASEYIHSIGENLLEIELSGAGEVFYSPFSLALLRSMSRKAFPRLKVHVVTNGQLLNERLWESLGEGRSLVKRIDVSIDAATGPTYESIRVGGSWTRLVDNIKFVSLLRRTGEVERLVFNFVMSARNFREIPLFIDMAQEFGVDMVFMTPLANWGKAMRYEFEKDAVHFPGHPLHAEFKKTVSDARKRSSIITFGLKIETGADET